MSEQAEETPKNILDVYITTSFNPEQPTMSMALYFRGERKPLTRENLINALASRIPGMYGQISSSDNQDTVTVPIPAETNHQLDYKAVVTVLEYMDYISNRKMSAWRSLDEINIYIPASLTVAQIKKELPDNADYDKSYNTNDEILKKWLGEIKKMVEKVVGTPVLHYLPRADVETKF